MCGTNAIAYKQNGRPVECSSTDLLCPEVNLRDIFYDVPFLRFQCLTLYNLTNTKQRKKHIKQNGLFRFKSKIVERFQNNIFISIYLLLAMDLFQTFQCRPSLTNTKMYCCQEPICPSGLFPKNIRKCSSDWQCPINHQCINSRNIEG